MAGFGESVKTMSFKSLWLIPIFLSIALGVRFVAQKQSMRHQVQATFGFDLPHGVSRLVGCSRDVADTKVVELWARANAFRERFPKY